MLPTLELIDSPIKQILIEPIINMQVAICSTKASR
jgi:hypothetical protein